MFVKTICVTVFAVLMLANSTQLPPSDFTNFAQHTRSTFANRTSHQEQPVQEKEKPYWEQNELKGMGALVRINSKDSAELKIFLMLEDGWETFGFKPKKSGEVTNSVKLNLPACFKLDGDMRMESEPVMIESFLESGEKLKAYRGAIELTQPLSVAPETKDISNVYIGGNVNLTITRSDQSDSRVISLPFVAFCISVNHDDINFGIPKTVDWVEDK